MKRALIFGSTGMTGWELSRRAPSHGFQPIALSREEVDITDAAAVRRAVRDAKPDIVLNAAAYTAVDLAERNREKAMGINSTGAGNVARAAAERDTCLIHISSDYVFDGRAKTPYAPDHAVNPLGAYGASKSAGEDAVRSINSRHAIVRTSWVFSHRGRNFVRTMLERSRTSERLRVVNDQYGRPTSAGDLADTLLQIGSRLCDEPALSGTWHFANDGVTTWYDVARAIFEMKPGGPPIEAISTSDFPTLARRPAYSVLDTSSLEKAFDITPRPWRDALRETLEQMH
jgi:dTDP-4-dehydrorhamnose reductase